MGLENQDTLLGNKIKVSKEHRTLYLEYISRTQDSEISYFYNVLFSTRVNKPNPKLYRQAHKLNNQFIERIRNSSTMIPFFLAFEFKSELNLLYLKYGLDIDSAKTLEKCIAMMDRKNGL